MIYGLYLSATGVLANSHRQDVIANNLANTQTVGFKRSLALFRERRAEALASPDAGPSNSLLDKIGGGLQHAPTYVDHSQGSLEETGNNLDIAIQGKGYFAVNDHGETRLTRNGRFMIDRQGYLILADGSDHRVLDTNQRPIQLGNIPQTQIAVTTDGALSTAGGAEPIARLGFFDVPDDTQLQQRGSTLLSHPNIKGLKPATGTMLNKFLEGSNADPTLELTQLMDAQRQLEANANMIRYQDQTLGRLVNEVGKIS